MMRRSKCQNHLKGLAAKVAALHQVNHACERRYHHSIFDKLIDLVCPRKIEDLALLDNANMAFSLKIKKGQLHLCTLLSYRILVNRCFVKFPAISVSFLAMTLRCRIPAIPLPVH